MKRALLLFVVGMTCFGLGWLANEMSRFADGVIEDGKRINRLKKGNPFFLNDSCRQNLSARQYWSPAYFTGGFSSIALQLNESGQMFLLDSTTVQDSTTEGRGIYHWTSDTTAKGNWCIRDNFIFCKFYNDKKFLENTFYVPNKGTGKKTIGLSIKEFPLTLTFPENTDTLIIRGIPCILIK